MTHEQRTAVERSLSGFSVVDKLELVDILVQSIRAEAASPDRPDLRREALDQLCLMLDAMPAAAQSDGLTNRDHDRILYPR